MEGNEMDDQEATRPPVATTPEFEEAPERSAVGRLFGIFVDPRGVFASMRVRPRFFLAFLVVLIFQTIFAVLVFQSGIVESQALDQLRSQGKDQQQIEAMERFFESPAAPIITTVSGDVAFVFGLLGSSGLLFFMGNLMLGGRLTFRHYLSVVAFSWVVSLVDHGARLALILARDSLDVRLGLGNLFGEEIGFLGRALDLATDPLFLWATAVSAIGVSVFARKGFGFGVATVLPGFLAGVILQALR
jgi:hypothetical protein